MTEWWPQDVVGQHRHSGGMSIDEARAGPRGIAYSGGDVHLVVNGLI